MSCIIVKMKTKNNSKVESKKYPRQRASPEACLYLSKNKQTEVVHENSEDLNQTKLMFLARVSKRAPAWGE